MFSVTPETVKLSPAPIPIAKLLLPVVLSNPELVPINKLFEWIYKYNSIKYDWNDPIDEIVKKIHDYAKS